VSASHEPEELEDWDGDDEEAELPIVPAPGSDGSPADLGGPRPALVRRRSAHAPPTGNTKRRDAAGRRREILREATGRSIPEPAEWEDDLAMKQRDRAASKLSTKTLTHNAGSGFGLA